MKINSSHFNFKANKMSKPQAEYISNTLKNSSSVDIVCHETTDRDSANSAIAMYEYMKQYGIQSRIILAQNLEGLKLRNTDYNIVQVSELEENNKVPDTVLCVDFSAQDRVSPNVLKHIQKCPKILCLDHHEGVTLKDHDYTHIKETLPDNCPVQNVSSLYVDSSAKSATSIIYRFFEAMEEDISPSMAYDLFYGLVDDCVKKGFVKCDGEKGTIEHTKELSEDKNAYEVYSKLKNKLSQEQIADIAKKIDIMASLTEEQREFYNSLYDRLEISESGKVGYVEIAPDDSKWQSLGGDNTVTSTILNRFRQNVLKSNDEKLKNIETAMVFYSAKENYRVSIHSKTNNLDKFYKFAASNISNPTSTIGGHSSRGGGKISSREPETCKNWVKEVIKCADLYSCNY